ncbi:type I polyketide synthase [Methylococcaceae bacterium WWC4]|nr:type I polyketide synthase [Methylococcaceae bacterium WWC4]
MDHSLTPLQKAFLAIERLQAKLEHYQRSQTEPIAVIGMACRFPGKADSVEQYWQMLQDEVDAVGPIPKERWDHSLFFDPSGERPGSTYVGEAAFLQQIDGFDAEFFAIPPREANSLDPQQRLLLELAHETLQHAGIASRRLKNSQTGVFIGIGQQDYLHLLRESGDMAGAELYTGTGNGFCFASGRLSYQLGLQGPSFSIDTACSSSLVALHQACLSLRAQECDLALTGGVQLMLSPSAFVLMSAAKALAKDGRCKSFAASADGYGRGEGAGMLALKRLSDAQRDGDRVLAVIRGSAVDHDGRSSGLTVPNGRAQELLLKKLLQTANARADEIAYIETHGTGTSLGDPIEYKALAEVLRKQSTEPLLLGSVKTNIGHLEAAAGIAGLIKLILAIGHNRIPASLHFDQPNPAIPWQDHPLKVATQAAAWPLPSKAGIVSSFGLSGTNAQVLVAAADCQQTAVSSDAEGSYLFKLSAKSEPALQDWLASHLKQLATLKAEDLADFCFSANIGRDDFNWRLAAVVDSVEQLQGFLQTSLAEKTWQSNLKAPIAPVFLFAGQGSVRAGAGWALYNGQPVFKAALDACDAELVKQNRTQVTELLYGDQASVRLEQTEHEQVALFALQYALAKMWLSWGVKPAMVLGHSLGEYAAACIAGVFDLQVALRLVVCRGRLMQALPEDGAMLAVYANEEQVRQLLSGLESKLAIAAVNADQQIVVSGAGEAIHDFTVRARQQDWFTKVLPVKRGFHSPQVDSMLADFETCLHGIAFNKPQWPFISTLTGKAESEVLRSVDYWLRHVRQPVLFKQALTAAARLGANFFIEFGGRPVLSSLVQQTNLAGACSLDAKGNDWRACQQVAAVLYQAGHDLDWPSVYQGRRRRLLSLPNYPWQRQRYWFSPRPVKADVSLGESIHPMLQQAITSPFWTGDLYQGRIACRHLPFLLDHKVFDRVVVAGACHLSALIAVGRERYPRQVFKIQDIEFIEALQLTEQEQRLLQVGLMPLGERQYQVKVISLFDEKAAEFTEHLSASMVAASADFAVLDLQELSRQCPEAVDVQHFYQLLMLQHVQLGESFRWFEQLFKGEHQALARIRPLTAQDKTFGLPPGLIDACFQLLGAAVPEQYTETYIPVAVEQLQLAAENRLTQLWCHACLTDGEIGRQGSIQGRVTLFNESGQVLAELSAVSLRKADSNAMRQALTVEKNAYAIVWRQTEALSKATVEPLASRWLVTGNALAKAFADTAAWAQWLDFDGFIASELNAEGVLLCLDSASLAEDMALQAAQNADVLLRFLQKAAAIGERAGVKIALLSRQARPVNDTDVLDPTLEGLSGLLRSFNHEYPLNPCQWLDWDETRLTAEHVVAVLTRHAQETEIALRGDYCFSPRLHTFSVAQNLGFSARGTYLLTGGSGALALQTAHWLAEKGVAKLVLISRHGIPDSGKDRLEAILRLGAEVIELKADIADAQQVQAILTEHGEDLRGIFHAAGVLQDSVVANLDSERLAQVLKPKVFGLWNLHRFSQGLNLDCFVAYSSMAAWLGAPGQGNYAMANGFMDALMQWRRRQGLPGSSMGWGPWAGAGMADIQTADSLALAGIGKLSAEQAFAFLERLLSDNRERLPAPVGLFNVDWRHFKFNRSSLTKAFESVEQNRQTLAEQLGLLPLEQRRRFLHRHLTEHVAAVLGLHDLGQLAAGIGFAELGMDSLMTLELRNRLQKSTQTALPSTLAFKYPSVDELFEFISLEVFPALFSEQAGQEKSPTEAFDQEEEDIAVLLERELSKWDSGQSDD